MKSSTFLFRAAQIAAMVLAMAAAPWAQAAEPVWNSKLFAYRADGKRLPDVIRDFGAAVGVPVMIEQGVEGTVNGTFNSSPADFMNAIMRAYGVVWYFDGSTLIAYPANSVRSRIFSMKGLTRAQVRQMLTALGLGDSRYPLRFNEAQETLVASGPPRHIEIVEAVLNALNQRQGVDRGPVVSVLPLRYAYAADRVSGTARLPGLVSTLSGIFSGRTAEGSGPPAVDPRATANRAEQPLRSKTQERSVAENFGLKPADPGAERFAFPRAPEGPSDGGDAAANRARNGAAETPTFFADEATNSVIVRAKADRMAEYEALVRSLDVAQDLVEMEVTIIDVSSDEFDALGIQWGFSYSRGSINVGSSSNGVPVANITTLITDAGRELLSRIRLLEGSGKANILSRPKVLGAANRVATMVDKRVASVRVAGNLDANLFSIEAGTTVQFQPQIVGGDGKRDVRLTLFISDGNFEGQLVDQVPVIKRTEIQTDATIPEGESLLIGGISIQSTTQNNSGVPGASRLPFFGSLFRSQEVKKAKSERLFLLTPKIIKVSGSDSARADVAATPSGPTTPARPDKATVER